MHMILENVNESFDRCVRFTERCPQKGWNEDRWYWSCIPQIQLRARASRPFHTRVPNTVGASGAKHTNVLTYVHLAYCILVRKWLSSGQVGTSSILSGFDGLFSKFRPKSVAGQSAGPQLASRRPHLSSGRVLASLASFDRECLWYN